MAKAIRVVVTSVYTYTPDLNDENYKAECCTTAEEAMELDRKDVESGEWSLDEFSERDPIVTYNWSIIDE